MIKKITLFFATLLILVSFALPAFAENPQRVVDNADLMSSEEEASLLEKLNTIYDTQNFECVVVTVKDLDGKSDMEYADDYYDYNGYGYGDSHDGCLMLIRVSSEYDRNVWISTTGYGITALTDYGIDYILDEVVPDFKSGDYYQGSIEYAELVSEFVDEARAGKPYDVNNVKRSDKDNLKAIGVSVIAALVISLIITLTIKGSYKPVKFNRGAANYLVDGSFNLKSSYDNFLYNTVSRVKIETESSSHGGSSTHSGSSGTSHGGGGRSF